MYNEFMRKKQLFLVGICTILMLVLFKVIGVFDNHYSGSMAGSIVGIVVVGLYLYTGVFKNKRP